MDKIFYQDFLMDFPYDENEYPIVEIRYVDDISHIQEYGQSYNLFDVEYGYYRTISFQYLHDCLKVEKWSEIFNCVATLDGVILVDDIIVMNDEVKELKEFYLKTYYWNLKQHNPNIYVYQKQANSCIDNKK